MDLIDIDYYCNEFEGGSDRCIYKKRFEFGRNNNSYATRCYIVNSVISVYFISM